MLLANQSMKVPVKSKKHYPIHRSAPDYVDQSTEAEISVTGIKVVDLLHLMQKVVKLGCLVVLGLARPF